MSRYLRHSDLLIEPKMWQPSYLTSFESFEIFNKAQNGNYPCLECKGEINITYLRKDGVRDVKKCPNCGGTGKSTFEEYEKVYKEKIKPYENQYLEKLSKYKKLKKTLEEITDDQYEILREYFYDAYADEHRYD